MAIERESVQVESRQEWRAWLEANYASSPGIWLVTFKKSAGDRYVSYEAFVEEALCFGWIDSLAKGVDADRTSITMTPRTPRSNWSMPNRIRVERLEAAGLIHPAGQVHIDAARADGRWPE